jgi:hypothetical protein
MRGAGIPTEIYYPRCLHLQHAFEFLGYHTGDFPIAEQASREVLSLPVYPELPDLQQDRVVQASLSVSPLSSPIERQLPNRSVTILSISPQRSSPFGAVRARRNRFIQ